MELDPGCRCLFAVARGRHRAGRQGKSAPQVVCQKPRLVKLSCKGFHPKSTGKSTNILWEADISISDRSSRGSTARSRASASAGCGHGSLPWGFQVKPDLFKFVRGGGGCHWNLKSMDYRSMCRGFVGFPSLGVGRGSKEPEHSALKYAIFEIRQTAKSLCPELLRMRIFVMVF